MPPMLKTIISDSCQERYQRIFRRMVLMECANIGVKQGFSEKKNSTREIVDEYEEPSSDACFTSVTTPEYTEEQLAEIYMRRHIQMIIPQFAHAFQMAIIQPIVARFREKTARLDTIFDLIECHKKMVAQLETAIFFEETPVIGKQVLKIIKIAKDFERQHREKSKTEDFVRTCANLRTLTKSIHEKIDNERMGLLFQGMSEVLYYTDIRNDSRNDQLTAAMKFRGAGKNQRFFFPSLSTPKK